MKRYALPSLLVLSLALNLGVFAAVGMDQFARPGDGATVRGHAMLADYLELDAEQRPHWEAEERRFLAALAEAGDEIRRHRERMIREILSERPDLAGIEAERAAISRLQEAQQRRFIDQLLAERAILTREQRRRLAELLLEQSPAGSLEAFLAHDIHRPEP